jgi:hypothetical protein
MIKKHFLTFVQWIQNIMAQLMHHKINVTSMKKLLLIFVLVSLLTNSAVAQSEQKESKYSVETDILWPFLVQTTRTHFVVKLWQKGHFRGDAYVGLNIDFPRDRETEGRFADYSLASGYRQYFWKGLHLEFSQTTGLGVLQNHVTTGKTYNSFDWLVSGYIGYKFEFAKKKLYVLPQFGVASVLYKSNPWPIYEDNALTKEVGESPFMLGSLRFGYNF